MPDATLSLTIGKIVRLNSRIFNEMQVSETVRQECGSGGEVFAECPFPPAAPLSILAAR